MLKNRFNHVYARPSRTAKAAVLSEPGAAPAHARPLRASPLHKHHHPEAAPGAAAKDVPPQKASAGTLGKWLKKASAKTRGALPRLGAAGAKPAVDGLLDRLGAEPAGDRPGPLRREINHAAADAAVAVGRQLVREPWIADAATRGIEALAGNGPDLVAAIDSDSGRALQATMGQVARGLADRPGFAGKVAAGLVGAMDALDTGTAAAMARDPTVAAVGQLVSGVGAALLADARLPAMVGAALQRSASALDAAGGNKALGEAAMSLAAAGRDALATQGSGHADDTTFAAVNAIGRQLVANRPSLSAAMRAGATLVGAYSRGALRAARSGRNAPAARPGVEATDRAPEPDGVLELAADATGRALRKTMPESVLALMRNLPAVPRLPTLPQMPAGLRDTGIASSFWSGAQRLTTDVADRVDGVRTTAGAPSSPPGGSRR